DKVLWESKPIKAKNEIQTCRVDVRDVDVLELRAAASDWEVGAEAVWLDPVVLRSGEVAGGAREWAVGPALKSGDLTARELGDGAANVLPCLAWSADGKSFYVLETSGVLRRIAWDGLKEEKRVELGATGKSLAVCRNGVLALVETPLPELRLLDATDLKMLKSGPLPEAVRVTSSPALAIAIAEGKVGDDKTGRVRIIDVAKFTVTQLFTDKQLKTGSAESSSYQ